MNESDGVVNVSIILPVYNAEKTLEKSVKSILTQSFKEYELIIIDDNSKDNSKKIIKKYTKKDKRIVFVENGKNFGLSYSLNKAIKLSKGNIIIRMDADDVSLKKRLEKQVEYLKRNRDIDVLGTGINLINSKGKYINTIIPPENHRDILKCFPMKNPIFHPTVAFRKDIMKFTNGYNKIFKNAAEDFYLWARLKNEVKFHNLQEALLNYRVNYSKNFIKIIKKFLIHIKIVKICNGKIKDYIYCFLILIKRLLVKLGLYVPKSIRKI